MEKNINEPRRCGYLFNFTSRIIFLLIVVLFLSNYAGNYDATDIPLEGSCSDDTVKSKDFFDACSYGNEEKVKEFLEEDPGWATSATEDGETCLHLTAISDSLEVTKMVVEGGADVNRRTSHEKGLRMTPLSWHVYSQNPNIVTYLLDSGALVNLDFDDVRPTVRRKVTALDIASALLESSNNKENGDSKDNDAEAIYDILIVRGGKMFEDLEIT